MLARSGMELVDLIASSMLLLGNSFYIYARLSQKETGNAKKSDEEPEEECNDYT